MKYLVEVFPIAPDRWIAVIDTGLGPFSTETATPEGVEAEVVESLRQVLDVAQPHFDLVDDLGAPWVPRNAPAQLQRLGAVVHETGAPPDG
jgi:hypothetical protein